MFIFNFKQRVNKQYQSEKSFKKRKHKMDLISLALPCPHKLFLLNDKETISAGHRTIMCNKQFNVIKFNPVLVTDFQIARILMYSLEYAVVYFMPLLSVSIIYLTD